jgi:hypothetical protein
MVKKPTRVSVQVVEENGDEDMCVVVDGVRIAKRGHPETPHAGQWVSIEQGWEVRDDKRKRYIEIRHNGVRVH